MNFDRESEFDKLVEECQALSIPHQFIKELKVTLTNGGEVSLTGEELLKPIPFSGSILANQFFDYHSEHIDNVDVFVDVPLLRNAVTHAVNDILNAHFQ